MTFNIYSFQDPKANCFGSLVVKLESPKDLVEQIARQLAKNPGDDIQNYVLWHLAKFDDAAGVILPVGDRIIALKDLVPKKEVTEDAAK